MNQYWAMLLIAGLLETAWAVGLKYTDGFTRLWPSLATIVAFAISMYLLALAARGIPIGTAYGVWVGIGALGTIVLGVVLFQESTNPWRMLFAVLLLVSLVGLKATSGE